MDINLPRISGIEGVAKLKVIRPALQIIMLTVYTDAEKIFKSLKAGASGYLLKQTPPAEILQAIADAGHVGPIARKIVEHFQQQPTCSEAENLSRANWRFWITVQGWHNKDIAQKLGIGFETVRTHLRRIYEKLHVSSRTAAVMKYLQR